ncbi:MAG: beta-ketoacyl synthase N-terminal-like domain-containing protein [Acetobacteraceae bacterium]
MKDQKKMDRFIHLAMVAATEAVEDSGWVPATEEDRCATGVMIGSGIGGLHTIYEASILVNSGKAKRLSPFFIPASLINLASGHVSIRYGFKGPNHSVVTACATGVHAIGDAARLIMLGDADVMVAGGAEAAVNPLGIAGFCASRALSTNFNDTPQLASRPWDRDRDGFVMGEGSGMLVLEELEHAKARGATIYAEISGYGLSGDAHHITRPGGRP